MFESSSESWSVDQSEPGFERRGFPRFEPLENRVWLGWWRDEEFLTYGAQLIDLSRSGAAIACLDAPPEGEYAWFCVAGEQTSGGARVIVVGRNPLNTNPAAFRVRVSFCSVCPEDLYQIALGYIEEPEAASAFS